MVGTPLGWLTCRDACRLVPAGTFVRADATRLDLPSASLDAVVCLYALIHMPLADQPRLTGGRLWTRALLGTAPAGL